MKTDWLHSATWAVIGSATRATALVSLATVCMGINEAAADEAGISFWLPGLYGSFAAAPGEPGWSFASVFYHPSVSAGAGTSFPRGGGVDVGIEGRGEIIAFGPTYTFDQPLWGAQAAVSLLAVAGRNSACVDATLAGPGGRHDLRRALRKLHRSRRSVAAVHAEVERRRQQLHDICDRRHSHRCI